MNPIFSPSSTTVCNTVSAVWTLLVLVTGKEFVRVYERPGRSYIS
jgi:hypothetical protein